MTAPPQSRRAVNLSIDRALLSEARELEINLSRAAEEGIRQSIRDVLSEAWRQRERAALESSNAYVESHGLPLSSRRRF